MSFDWQVEAAESITAQAISAALQHNRCGPVELHNVFNDKLIDVDVVRVDDAFFERHIDRVVAPVVGANFIHVARSREEGIAVFVKGDCHDPIGQVERLLYPITMVNVNIDVEDSWMISEMKKELD